MATLKGGDRMAKVLAEIGRKASAGKFVRAGFLEGATYPDGTPIATIAAIQEFGDGNIPPRPFFRAVIKDESPHWGADLGKVLKAVDYDAPRALGLMGQEIAGEIQQSIRDWSDPPNAPSTVAKKGFQKPLVDTGHMLKSVDSEVEE